MDLKSKRLQPIVEDRISALPDVLLCHIVSFLETKYAVRTIILSTRWKNIWASVTNLHFLNMNPHNDIGFNRFVNSVLLLRNSLDIPKFRLKCCYVDENRADIHTWIRTAVRRNVVELDLSISNYSSTRKFGLPKCLFTCKTLVVLKLNLTCVTFLPKSGCFPSLKFLNFTARLANCDSIENLFSHCPVLEHLIISLYVLYPRKDLHISAPKLKSLKICLSRGQGVFNMFIKSPKLENLDLSEIISSTLQQTLSNYRLDNLKSLVKANIDLKGRDSETPAFVDRGNVLLAEISGVKHLSLSGPCLKACELPAFDSLNKLKLYDWELLAVFLKASPNLEDLVLDIGTKSNEKCIEHQWNPPEFVPKCLLSHLKTIFIRGFKGQQVEIGAAQYLLKNGRALKKMTICTEKDLHYIQENKLLEEFLMFQKTCQVEFIKM